MSILSVPRPICANMYRNLCVGRSSGSRSDTGGCGQQCWVTAADQQRGRCLAMSPDMSSKVSPHAMCGVPQRVTNTTTKCYEQFSGVPAKHVKKNNTYQNVAFCRHALHPERITNVRGCYQFSGKRNRCISPRGSRPLIPFTSDCVPPDCGVK
jgi:hypothetical protein